MKTSPSILALAVLAGALNAQNIVLPDNHNLCENVSQLGNVGSTSWWRGATGGRFQIIYEASHFLGKAGVSGPITITRLKFRGEDGEVNLGGQVYSGVTVELGSTTLTNLNMSTTWTANRVPTLPQTTTMGTLGTTGVTVAASTGSIPNNYHIEIDLAAIGASFVFDPTGPEPNLLIDITFPTAPANAAPLALIATQDTTGGVVAVRGRGVNSLTPGGLTGTTSTAPPVVGLEFTGGGGHATILPARNEFYGAACGGSPSAFYQAFLNGQAFDLGAGLTLTPDNVAAPTVYTVTAGAPAVDLTQVNAVANSIADDALVAHALGFTFAYPGGSTTSISPCTNGFIWLDPAMTLTSFVGNLALLLGGTVASPNTARLIPCWHDFNCGRNTASNAMAGMHVLTDSSGGPGFNKCYVTWWDIGEFNSVSGVGITGHAVWTFQVCMDEATGVVEYRYGTMPAIAASSTTSALSYPTMVGFSRGQIAGINSADPQSRDLSFEVPFSTGVEGGLNNMGQTAVSTPVVGGPQYSGRAFGGQSLRWNANNVPAGAIVGVQLLDIAANQPGFMGPGITAPGCMLSTSTTATVWEFTVSPGATVTGTVPCMVPHGVDGTCIYAQYVVLDGLVGAPNFITVSSNAIKHTAGLN